jgi:hypothetical protein
MTEAGLFAAKPTPTWTVSSTSHSSSLKGTLLRTTTGYHGPPSSTFSLMASSLL